MVVDDEPDTVKLMSFILKSEGYQISTAYDGKECLKKLERERPDLVLLDIMMPGMSGWDVFEKIKKKHKKLKVAFVSVVEISPERKQALVNDGLTDYINKPFTKTELLERVKSILS